MTLMINRREAPKLLEHQSKNGGQPMQPVTIIVQKQGRLVGQVLLKDCLTIGRIPDNSLILAEPSISGYHAEVQLTAQGAVILDLGSSHGTFMAGHKLQPKQRYPWLAGETVDISPFSLCFQSSS